MNTAISIPTFSGSLNGEQQTLINARDLHQFLDVGRDFNTWMKGRIKEYGFAQAIDFTETPVLGNRGFWKTETKNYHLSIDMAKELAMVERSDKGRAIRRYFIEMEKSVRTVSPFEVKKQAWLIDSLQDELFRLNPAALKLTRYFIAGLSTGEIAKLLDCHASTVRYRLKKLAQLGLVQYPAPTPQALPNPKQALLWED